MPEALGIKLKRVREGAGFTISELSERTRIPSSYLLSLEREEFEKLPPPVYITGFLQSWARACGTSTTDVVSQFHRENKYLLHSKKESKLPKPSGSRVVISFWYMFIGAVLAVVVALVAFFYFNQIRSLATPSIEITAPVEFSTVTGEQDVAIEGSAQATDSVLIGEETIAVQGGRFNYLYPLEDGLNTITIIAEGANGERIEVIRKVLKI